MPSFAKFLWVMGNVVDFGWSEEQERFYVALDSREVWDGGRLDGAKWHGSAIHDGAGRLPASVNMDDGSVVQLDELEPYWLDAIGSQKAVRPDPWWTPAKQYFDVSIDGEVMTLAHLEEGQPAGEIRVGDHIVFVAKAQTSKNPRNDDRSPRRGDRVSLMRALLEVCTDGTHESCETIWREL